MKIVPMRPEHIPALCLLEQICFSDPWSKEALEEELRNPTARFTVALAGEEVAGYLGFHHVLDEGAVANLAVFPAFRRQGVARELLAELIAWSRKNGLRTLTLEVRPSNAPAVALYEQTGFRRVGTRPGYYRHPAEDAALYTLFIEENEHERTGI